MEHDMGGDPKFINHQGHEGTRSLEFPEGFFVFLRVFSCPWWCKPFPGARSAHCYSLSQSPVKAQRRVSLHKLPISPQFPKCLSRIEPLLMLRDHQASLAQ